MYIYDDYDCYDDMEFADPGGVAPTTGTAVPLRPVHLHLVF